MSSCSRISNIWFVTKLRNPVQASAQPPFPHGTNPAQFSFFFPHPVRSPDCGMITMNTHWSITINNMTWAFNNLYTEAQINYVKYMYATGALTCTYPLTGTKRMSEWMNDSLACSAFIWLGISLGPDVPKKQSNNTVSVPFRSVSALMASSENFSKNSKFMQYLKVCFLLFEGPWDYTWTCRSYNFEFNKKIAADLNSQLILIKLQRMNISCLQQVEHFHDDHKMIHVSSKFLCTGAERWICSITMSK